jgi:membrane fusion protein, copper/silver efflux system
MRTRTPTTIMIAAVLVVVLAVAGGHGLYQFGMQRGMAMSNTVAPTAGAEALPQSIAQGEDATRRHITSGIRAGDVDPKFGRRVLYYHDPMVPGNKFDKPAKSPFMDMMLVPVYADSGMESGGAGSQVTVSARIQQNLGVRTAAVTEGTLSPQVAAVGSIAFNERDQVIVQTRATAYVERLWVRATFDRVVKGQSMAELYVPDWIVAQEEFLSVRRMHSAGLAPLDELVLGARQRMRQAGMSDAQIALVASSGQTQPRFTLFAPIGGVVTELMAREGMSLAPGATLFRINGLSTVWANAEVPESQSALLRVGARVRATVQAGVRAGVQTSNPAAPLTQFDGKLQAVLPDVNPSTRTLKARVELANAQGALVPGMFVQMLFIDARHDKALLVPTEAIIQTGKRTVVMLAEEAEKPGQSSGRFRPVDVEIGIESGGQTEVKRGLQIGQRVVVSSQFLIDSEASLKGVESRLGVEPDAAAAAASAPARAPAPASGSKP